MSILVTGGAGFIGSHFIERLHEREADARVICLDDFNDYYNPALKRANIAGFASDARVEIVEQSFCDTTGLNRLCTEQRVRRIVHLGAYAGVRASVARPEVFVETNVGGTLSVLEAARAGRVERLVFVSSSTVYGSGVAVPFTEDGQLGVPLSPYGVTKRAAELMCLSYHTTHALPVVCLRPFSVYGPRIRPDLAMWVFAESILAARPIPLLGDGSQRRDFTHVSDVCNGILAALSTDAAVGQCINLGHDEPVAIRDLVTLLEDALETPATIDRRPACPEDLPVTQADLSKATRLLGYRPMVSVADGVRDFARWFRQVRKPT